MQMYGAIVCVMNKRLNAPYANWKFIRDFNYRHFLFYQLMYTFIRNDPYISNRLIIWYLCDSYRISNYVCRQLYLNTNTVSAAGLYRFALRTYEPCLLRKYDNQLDISKLLDLASERSWVNIDDSLLKYIDTFCIKFQGEILHYKIFHNLSVIFCKY